MMPTGRAARQAQFAKQQKNDHVLMALVMCAVAIVPMSVVHGFVLKTLWNWFVPLAFTGAPRLGIGTAYGLSLVGSYFLSALAADSSKKDQGVLVAILTLFFGILFRATLFIALGFVVHLILT